MRKTIKPNMGVISKVARSIELEEIYLLRSESNLLDGYFENKIGVKLVIKQLSHTEVLELIPKKRAKILVDLMIKTLDAESLSSKAEEVVFFIKGSFILVYSLDEKSELSKDDLNMFADVNGKFNCWPYWREFVQSITTRMGLPPLTVPLLKVSNQKSPGAIPKSPRKKSTKSI